MLIIGSESRRNNLQLLNPDIQQRYRYLGPRLDCTLSKPSLYLSYITYLQNKPDLPPCPAISILSSITPRRSPPPIGRYGFPPRATQVLENASTPKETRQMDLKSSLTAITIFQLPGGAFIESCWWDKSLTSTWWMSEEMVVHREIGMRVMIWSELRSVSLRRAQLGLRVEGSEERSRIAKRGYGNLLLRLCREG